MIDFDYKQRLEDHISALISAYDKQILLLNRDLAKKEVKDNEPDKEELKITDAQVKSFSEGIAKSAETANTLLRDIKSKIQELDELEKKEDEKSSDKVKKPQQKEDETSNNPMNDNVS